MNSQEENSQYLIDCTGQRSFHANVTCIREHWAQEDRFNNELNNCLSWEVKQGTDYPQLLLVSRPEKYSLELTSTLANYLLIYNEPAELAPELHKPIWDILLGAGWEVWGAFDGNMLNLCARNPAHVQDVCVSQARRPGVTHDARLGDYMWEELYKRVTQFAK